MEGQFVSLYILMVFHKDIYIEMDQSEAQNISNFSNV